MESDIDLIIRNRTASLQSDVPDEPIPAAEYTNNGRWCSDTDADDILRPPDPSEAKLAKMALHFVLSSPITPEAQALGFLRSLGSYSEL